jgi:large subunit ribosomal protein L6
VSRIGKLPVQVPSGVTVELKGVNVRVKGPKGELERSFSNRIGIALDSNQIIVTRNSEETADRALHGTTRALLANMLKGVSQGFEVVLEVEGVGYRAEMEGKTLVLYVGFSHPVKIQPPEGITFEVDQKTRQFKISGFDKDLVGQVAANIRNVRPPEPYHGKGLHYLGEHIRRKAGKAGKGAVK